MHPSFTRRSHRLASALCGLSIAALTVAFVPPAMAQDQTPPPETSSTATTPPPNVLPAGSSGMDPFGSMMADPGMLGMMHPASAGKHAASVLVRWPRNMEGAGELLLRFANPGAGRAPGIHVEGVTVPIRVQGSFAGNTGTIEIFTPPDAEPKARRESIQAFSNALKKEMDSEYRKTLERFNEQRAAAAEQADRAAVEVRKVEEQIAQLRQELRQISGRFDVSENGLTTAATDAEAQAQNLSVDVSAMDARRKAIEKAIAELTVRAEADAKQDAITAELEKILASRMQELRLSESLHKEGNISQSEIENVRAKVAEARIRLLERREALVGGAGADTLKQLNKELLMLNISRAEMQARLEMLTQRLERLHGAARHLRPLDDLNRRLQEQELSHRRRQQVVAQIDQRLTELTAPLIDVRGIETPRQP